MGTRIRDPDVHALCRDCYATFQPGRGIMRLVPKASPAACCACGQRADPPIYYKGTPDTLAFECEGIHVDLDG